MYKIRLGDNKIEICISVSLLKGNKSIRSLRIKSERVSFLKGLKIIKAKFSACHYSGMVMASLNINGLLAHIDELRIFISNTKVDILCINETPQLKIARSIYQLLKLLEEIE